MIGTVLKESLRGKSIYRTLTNVELGGRQFLGNILDIGGGEKRGSHYRFLNIASPAQIQTANIDESVCPDFVLDVTKEPLPLQDGSQDTVFCFNTLEHLSRWDNMLAETLRVMRPGGTFFGYIPFLVGVHADPHDYVRMTAEGLERAFKRAGFSSVQIAPVGRGPFTAAYAQVAFIFPSVLRVLLLSVALMCDWTVQRLRPDLRFRHKYVLTYIFLCKKKV